MDGAATIVWLAEPGADASPNEEASRALADWASAHGVVLAPPQETLAHPNASSDASLATSVEREIARGRDALAGLDFDAAERALARAEAIVREHPELGQAAWLRAEVERGWSARWLREGDEPRAKRAWQRAIGLDGGRAAGLGEKAFEPMPSVTARIRFVGDPGASALRLDGEPMTPGEVTRSEGEHALAIIGPDGAPSWAAWVTLAQGADVRVEAPPPGACSAKDIKRARIVDRVVHAETVRCGSWAVAVAGTGAVLVATCAGGACAPFVELRLGSSTRSATGPDLNRETPPASHRHWPAWATWTLAGLGVAGAAVGIAAAAGAFRSAPTVETQYVNGGLSVRSF